MVRGKIKKDELYSTSLQVLNLISWSKHVWEFVFNKIQLIYILFARKGFDDELITKEGSSCLIL